jgi:two-component system sensor histidine kinase KdpD
VLSNHEVVIAIPADIPAIRADRTLLGQVLVNLLENAAKFAPAGTEIRVQAQRTGNDVRIDVIDHGPGIPAADRERVFDMFYRIDEHEKRQGSGLGLAICKGFVAAMGGTIQVLPAAEVTGQEDAGTIMSMALAALPANESA